MDTMNRTRAYALTIDSSRVMEYAHEIMSIHKRHKMDVPFSECLKSAWSSARAIPFRYCKEDFYGNKEYHMKQYENNK